MQNTKTKGKEVRYLYSIPKFEYYYNKYKNNDTILRALNEIKSIVIENDTEPLEHTLPDYYVELINLFEKSLKILKHKDKDLYKCVVDTFLSKVLGATPNTSILEFWFEVLEKFYIYSQDKDSYNKTKRNYNNKVKSLDYMELYFYNDMMINQIKNIIKIDIKKYKFTNLELMQVFNTCSNFEECLNLLNFYKEVRVYNSRNYKKFNKYIERLGYGDYLTSMKYYYSKF